MGGLAGAGCKEGSGVGGLDEEHLKDSSKMWLAKGQRWGWRGGEQGLGVGWRAFH